jgi:transcriptional regulator with XRE-family HTH domain
MGDVPPFAELMSDHLRRAGLSRLAFARLVGRSDGNISNILSADPSRRTQYRPPLDEIPHWAEVLGLSPAERAQLIELAELAHTPPAIRARYLAMQALLATVPAQAAEAAQPYRSDPSAHDLARIMNPDDHPRQPAPTYPRPAPIRGGPHG